MFHILLLPQVSYWEWVQASREYVLEFDIRLTPDPEAAASFMAPRQVVSFPSLAEGFARLTQVEQWFADHHPEIRLDPIPAAKPEEFKLQLAARIESADRFGQRQRPFSLLWPTEYPVITQKFGANPRIYQRFGMPGHEGVDLRALPNTKIFAGAEGEVYRVELDPTAHAYGIHVRIRHRDGYRSVYGHLAKALVAEGDRVEAGQVIGTADTTGAAVLSHLHFTLKRDFATERGETNYPVDVIDPTSYLIFPESVGRKALSLWPPAKCLVGAHARIGAPIKPHDIELIRQAKLECVALELGEPAETVERLREIDPGMLLMAKVSAQLSGEPLSTAEFLEQVEPQFSNLYRAGVHFFELVPNANLESEGWGRSWANGAEFAAWYGELYERLKQRFPEARLGFPGLSPGEAVAGHRQLNLDFLEGGQAAAMQSDWLGVNCYWTEVAGMDRLREGRLYEEYRLRFPEKLLFITEFGNPSPSTDRRTKASQYVAFLSRIRESHAIGAAFGFTLSASSGFEALTWDEITVAAIGARAF